MSDRIRPLVGYVRVSTAKQGASGLGLEAQLGALEAHGHSVARPFLRVFQEIETSTKLSLSNRPKLREAIDLARLTQGTLVIAKLDRLARNVAFTSALMESGVDFSALDCPSASRLTIHILAAVAEDEARRIGERTRVALAARRARGLPLGAQIEGCANLTTEAIRKGIAASAIASRQRAHHATQAVASIVIGMRADGASLQSCADHLNALDYPTRKGAKWTPTAVRRVIVRAQLMADSGARA